MKALPPPDPCSFVGDLRKSQRVVEQPLLGDVRVQAANPLCIRCCCEQQTRPCVVLVDKSSARTCPDSHPGVQN